jgi:repressor of nif and glnA expression
MNEKDDAILEYLQDVGAAEPPKVIHWNLTEDRGQGDFSLKTLRRRLDRLEEASLVEVARESGRYFRITDQGERYLSGEYDVTEAEQSESD